jgi:hypothetical protein
MLSVKHLSDEFAHNQPLTTKRATRQMPACVTTCATGLVESSL